MVTAGIRSPARFLYLLACVPILPDGTLAPGAESHLEQLIPA